MSNVYLFMCTKCFMNFICYLILNKTCTKENKFYVPIKLLYYIYKHIILLKKIYFYFLKYLYGWIQNSFLKSNRVIQAKHLTGLEIAYSGFSPPKMFKSFPSRYPLEKQNLLNCWWMICDEMVSLQKIIYGSECL